ncbi:MAG: pyridoxal-phosphate dependent enzyme [Firmicutes bacterium]|nr:pyridoxal-phosphate dependent enzyme [Bacillota bacterium]
MFLGYDKIDFLHLPTHLERLDNISEDLGINLYIKRDDLTSLAGGGNKLRKLEYLLKEARDRGATFLLTVGGAQTNHGRLTLAVARKFGMKGAIVAVDEYPGELSANLLLDGMMGCDVWLKKPDGTTSEGKLLKEAVTQITDHYEGIGEKVYYIPMGGSNEIGALGYYECAKELVEQTKELGLSDCRIVTTVGSFGTYMGLFLAIVNEKLPMKLTGISVLPMASGLQNYAKKYFDKCCDFFGLDELKKTVEAGDFHVTDQYDRGAYNNPCKEVRDAMYYMAEKEAIILDPCYTGKCFAGLLEMVRKGEIAQGENVIFIHTGGMPGINTPSHRIEIEKEREKFIHII